MENLSLRALKELGIFLGGRLDALGTRIDGVKDAVKDSEKDFNLDLISRTIAKLKTDTTADVERVTTTLKQTTKEHNAKIAELTATLSGLEKTLKEGKNDKLLLVRIDDALEHLAEGLAALTKEAGVDRTAPLLSKITELTTAVKANKPVKADPVKPVDLSSVGKGLSELKMAIGDLSRAVAATDSKSAFAGLLEAIKALKLDIPKTIKLDDTQFRALSNVGRGGGGGQLTASGTPVVANVAMTTADTEYSYTFPANTVGFQLRTRDVDVPLLVAFAAGKLPTSGDGSAYFTVPAYFVEKTPGVEWSGKTIYVQTGSASQVLEIINYVA